MNNSTKTGPALTFPKLTQAGVVGAAFGGDMHRTAARYGAALDGFVVFNLLQTRRGHRGQCAQWEAFDALTFRPLRHPRVSTLKELKRYVAAHLAAQVVGL